MNRRFSSAVLTLALLCGSATGVQRLDLSPEAQALVPEGKGVVIELQDGTKVEGTLARETDDQVTVRIQRAGGIGGSRTIARSEIKRIGSGDISPLLAARLLDLRLDLKFSLEESEYERRLNLFNEFLQKCKGSAQYATVEAIRDATAEEHRNVQGGLQKVAGEWFTPVRGTVRRFEVHTAQMQQLEKRDDFASNEKVRTTYEQLKENRRAAARALPQMMQERVPRLIIDQKLDEAAEETTAFLKFWIDQVIRSEGEAAQAFREMDFDYILRLQRRIMDAYRRTGQGDEKPRGKVREPDMVYVPGGYFLMGDENAGPSDDAFPVRIIYVSPFLIDRYEVSNAQYRGFVEYVKKSGDSAMEHPDAPPLKKHDAEGWKNAGKYGRDGQPVVGVDWFDAYAYAKWAGKRLPTEAEWEKAARGMDFRVFPWGGSKAQECTVNWLLGREFLAGQMDEQNPPQPVQPEGGVGCSCVKQKKLPPPPPTQLPSELWDVDKALPSQALTAIEKELFAWQKRYEGPYGTLHMACNAAEWVHDWYSSDAYSRNDIRDPQGPEKGAVHVFRGGSYLSTKASELTTYRRSHPGAKREEDGCDRKGVPFIGFRCARSLDIVRE